jgi:hypothetical protein
LIIAAKSLTAALPYGLWRVALLVGDRNGRF